MTRRVEIAIIGAGPAGVAAAVQCARLGMRPWLCDKSGTAGGLVENAFCVENYPGLEPTDGPAFARLLGNHLERFDVTVAPAIVESVTPSRGGFLLEGDFGSLSALALIAAVGTEAKRLEIPGAKELEGDGLYYEVGGKLRAEASSTPIKKVIVIGGGEAALDYSLTLAQRGAKVKVLVRGRALRATGRLVDLATSNDSVEVLFESTPRSIRRKEVGIEVELEAPHGELPLSADAAVAAVGRRTRVFELINNLDEAAARTLSTSIPGLFIAGDARTGTLGQAGMAVGEGLDAAMKAVSFVRAGDK